MKTNLILILNFVILAAFANDDKYTQLMTKNIDALYKAQSIEELQLAINSLERIGNAEKTKWEPFYYVSFGYIMQATKVNEGAKKDQFLDLAAAALGKSKTVKENESEILALEGFIYMLKVTVDPAARGPQYSGLAMMAYGKAVALNPDNPRALALMAQMQYGTAQFFKSPVDEACATLAKSLEKFDSYKSENPVAPIWGKGMAEGMKQNCQAGK